MIEVESPTVYLVAEPTINVAQMRDYLTEVGGEGWANRVLGEDDGRETVDAQNLVEFMGRLCYRSWEPGLNRNVTRVREDQGDYLLNVLRQRHGSVLEHAVFSFVVHDCSRVLTAELNRHRAGASISEQSLRYVRLDSLRFRMPPTLTTASHDVMREVIGVIEEGIARIHQIEGIDDSDADFTRKKTVTSATRRIAPLGLATDEGWTANVRTIRHVIEMRSALGAEEEIRVFADQLAQIMQARCPLLFGDYLAEWQSDEHRSLGAPATWTTDNGRV